LWSCKLDDRSVPIADWESPSTFWKPSIGNSLEVEMRVTRHAFRVTAVALALLVAGLAPRTALQAQDQTRAAARELVRKWQDAIVNVHIVVKMRTSVGGREIRSNDETMETVGTVIDPSGLTVVSLASINPGAMVSKMMGAAAAAQKVEIASEATDVKIRLADGRELPATIALRDQDLNLAFLRPTAKPAQPLVAIDLADAARPAMLDQVVVLGRLGRVGGWTPSGALRDVVSIIERPRTFYVLGGEATGLATPPAFLANGKVVGLLTLRQIETERPGAFAALSGSEGYGMLAVILPAADVLEIAKQATEKK
jgi:S1-C subfamily serine protease